MNNRCAFGIWVWAAVFAVLAMPPLAWAGAPQRIASINICTDQLLMSIAPPERIVSVSWLAVDNRTSAMAAEAAAFHQNHAAAEELINLSPDLVVAGTHGSASTIAVLEKIGIPVVRVPIAATFPEIRANIRMLAAAIGAEARGEAVIAAMDNRLASIPPITGRGPVLATYAVNGWTAGAGTLAHTIVTAAGFRPIGDVVGFSGTVNLGLERFVTINPDIVVLGEGWDDPPSLAGESLRHPALRGMEGAVFTTLPTNLWLCGTPRTVEAVERLAKLRARK